MTEKTNNITSKGNSDADNIPTDKRQIELDLPEEKNKIEHLPEQEIKTIDRVEKVTRAARQREIDNERNKNSELITETRIETETNKAIQQEAESVQPNIGNQLNLKQQNIDEKEAKKEKTDKQQSIENEKIRQIKLKEQIDKQYRISGSKYYFKDRDGDIAFKDKGSLLVTAFNDDRIAKSMAHMAEAKGWKSIKVSGHKEFQREVWLEANLRGLEVRGYKPTEQDVKHLESRQEQFMKNKIEQTSKTQKKQTEQDSKHANKTDTEQSRASVNDSISSSREYSGHLIEHGYDNYEHDKKNSTSYFVKLQTDNGEKTIWGKDLARAIKTSNVQKGDEVEVNYKGSESVNITVAERNQDGKKIGTKEITTLRNTWEVEKTDQQKIIESVASTFIDSKVPNKAQRQVLKQAINQRLNQREQQKNVPSIMIHDKDAPRKQQEIESPHKSVEQTQEQSR